ncbi:hypothetical protein M3Y94_00982200 [Aphelenchoides besseyi]|nr:hypothetical protein M3Y94_00982200 [Aphelenchoides besseyi]
MGQNCSGRCSTFQSTDLYRFASSSLEVTNSWKLEQRSVRKKRTDE